MLPLDSPRWNELGTFFGRPQELPRVLDSWLKAVGTDQEQLIYLRDLLDLFLHQATILDSAFAVVPWLVKVCADGISQYRGVYLVDIAIVEANRVKFGLYGADRAGEPLPEWLKVDYIRAVEAASGLVESVLREPLEEDLRDVLTRIKPALFGNAELAWKCWRGEAITKQATNSGQPQISPSAHQSRG